MVAEASPIRRNVTIEDVGNVAAFLLSDLAAGVTAEITYVDGGFSHVGCGGSPNKAVIAGLTRNPRWLDDGSRIKSGMTAQSSLTQSAK